MLGWEADFAEFFAARASSLRRLAYALCGDWHTAEDIVQGAFVRLYRQWRRVRPETADAYIRRSVVNAYMSHRRDRRREWVSSAPPDRPAPPGPDAAARLDLDRALATLPKQQRVMVVLRHLEDLPVSEVALLLGVAEGTVKSQTAKALKRLKDLMSEETDRTTGSG